MDLIEEYKKCKGDPEYFISNYVHFMNKGDKVESYSDVKLLPIIDYFDILTTDRANDYRIEDVMLVQQHIKELIEKYNIKINYK